MMINIEIFTHMFTILPGLQNTDPIPSDPLRKAFISMFEIHSVNYAIQGDLLKLQLFSELNIWILECVYVWTTLLPLRYVKTMVIVSAWICSGPVKNAIHVKHNKHLIIMDTLLVFRITFRNACLVHCQLGGTSDSYYWFFCFFSNISSYPMIFFHLFNLYIWRTLELQF